MSYSQYDEIANEYDSLFVDEDSLNENREVGDMLLPLSGSILDIGCGTGLLLKIKSIEPQDYLGIDPSEGMLKVFKSNHPRYKVENKTFEEDQCKTKEYDCIVSLFGSISYVSPSALNAIEESGKKHFLMFYSPNYHPVTYEKTHVEIPHWALDVKELFRIFKHSTIETYHNYIIVKNF